MDPFEVLGVTPDTPRPEVRAAYRRLARRHHPDLHADAPPGEQDRHQRRMAEVTSAWRLINDPTALARHRARSARAGAAPTENAAASGRSRAGADGFDYRRAAPSEFDVPLSGTWDRTPPRSPRPGPEAGRRRAGRRRAGTRRAARGSRTRRPVLWLAVMVAIVVGMVLLGFTDAASDDAAASALVMAA